MTYIPKSFDNIKEDIIINIIQNLDTIVDVNQGSVLDIFVSSFSNELEVIYEDIQTVNKSLQLSTATSTDLDEIGEAAGINRMAGVNSTAVVSFIKSNVATSSFTIPQGTLISTNPNADTVYTFSTDSEETFETSVSNLNIDFYNGVKYYKVDNRHFQDLTITGFVSGTDFSIEENYNDILFNNDTFELIDDCNATTGWSILGDADTITNNTTYYQRYSKSLNLIKTATTSVYFGYEKNLSSSVNITNNKVIVHYRVDDAATLAKINKITIYAGNDSSNNFYKEFSVSDLITGGAKTELPYLSLDYTDASINGNPDKENIDYIKIYIELNNASDTIASGKMLMDFWFTADSDTYQGTVIKWLTFSTTDTSLVVGYKPLSYDIQCTATTIGTDGNVAIGEINYKVSSLSNIDSIYNFEAGINGTDTETDFNYRERIKSAAALRGSSTVPSIEANVKALSSVKDCVVIDTPKQAISGEVHTYVAADKEFRLNYEQALNDSGLTITGYTKDTDFELNGATNKIVFGIGGTDPANNEVLTVNYNCARLGKIDVIVTGETGVLSSGELIDVDNELKEVVSAGIDYTIKSPTYTSTDISITINVDDNYNPTDVKIAVETLLESIFNVNSIGETLYISYIINLVSYMVGVINISNVLIDGSAADKSADKDEILSKGTITVTVA